MLASTVIGWYLVVHLQSPNQPYEAAQWNKRYGSFISGEQCEDYAKQQWLKYNIRYAETMTPWMQTFTTDCYAQSHHHAYKWFTKCDQFNNCTTRKYKGPRP